MVGARAFAAMVASATPFHATEPSSRLALLRVSCRHSHRIPLGRARSSRRDTAETDTGGVGGVLKDDSSYLLTLVLGSVAGATAIKYGSILLPDITRPNIVQALLMVSLPVVVAALLLLKASSKED